jgi:hypothetical protein
MDDPRPPVREGYNRDPLPYQTPPPDATFIDHDPIIVNWPLVGRIFAVVGATAGFFVPASIIIWRIAL